MAEAVSISEEVPVAGRAEPAPWWPVFAVLGMLWLFAVRQFRFEWTINPQYTYGWTVPFLAAYLFMERWKRRPPAQGTRSRKGLAFAVIVLALLLAPVRLIQESAPDWRLLGWALGAVCVALTLAAVYFAGGRGWLRHFAFPIAFFLVAVPWPVPVEQSLVQLLMRSVTAICVEALSWAGIPAKQIGNVIQISATGKVGIEEACSGVRSLQTTLMIALFMGELLRFGIVRRIVLLAGGLGVAFVCNASRAYFLVWVSAKSGTEAVAKWHDNVGMAVLFGSLVGVGILCAILNPKRGETEEASLDPGLLRAAAPPGRGILIALAAWLVIIEAGTEMWYRAAEARSPRANAWTVNWPAGQKGFRDVEFSDVTRNILKYTDARSAVWADEQGARWAMVLLHWAPGRTSVQLARAHGPEVCLPAGGAVMTADLGPRPMRIKGIDLPLRAYVFRAREQVLYVFYCLWEQRPDIAGAQSVAAELNIPRRLEAVRKGVRNAGQQAIEVAVSDVAGPEQAEAVVRRFLEKTIQP